MVTMHTTISDAAILYTVTNADGVEVWRREVPLMQTAAYRAGGYHVTDAARAQERVAVALAAGLVLENGRWELPVK